MPLNTAGGPTQKYDMLGVGAARCDCCFALYVRSNARFSGDAMSEPSRASVALLEEPLARAAAGEIVGSAQRRFVFSESGLKFPQREGNKTERRGNNKNIKRNKVRLKLQKELETSGGQRVL